MKIVRSSVYQLVYDIVRCCSVDKGSQPYRPCAFAVRTANIVSINSFDPLYNFFLYLGMGMHDSLKVNPKQQTHRHCVKKSDYRTNQ